MGYLAAAFIAVWLLVGLYVVYIGRRQNQIQAELMSLNELLEEKERARGG